MTVKINIKNRIDKSKVIVYENERIIAKIIAKIENIKTKNGVIPRVILKREKEEK
jgi:hypothetical protein